MQLGAHVSAAGGLDQAPPRGRAIGADVIQVFTRNQVQWRVRRVTVAEARAFGRSMADSGLRQAISHGSYLVNLASPDAVARRRSRAAFLAELRRCHALGIRHLVFHPGAHLGAGERAGLRRVAASLNHVLRQGRSLAVRPLIEVTAGQGSCLGHRFEQLAEILSLSRWPERLGVCLDTCHLLAAGYDIASPRGYAKTMDDLSAIVGLEKVEAVHLNDARHGLGSRRDRHAPIGHGCLGERAFRRLVRDERLRHLPMMLETPGPAAVWRKEIALLRRLAG
jgi:deoxyribonuclease-4